MKLATFERHGQERIGALDASGHIVDLLGAYAIYLRKSAGEPHADQLAAAVLGRDMVEFLRRGDGALDDARKALAYLGEKSHGVDGDLVFDPDRIRLMAPVPRPGALISAGKNFSDHVAEMASKKGPAAPVAFLKL